MPDVYLRPVRIGILTSRRKSLSFDISVNADVLHVLSVQILSSRVEAKRAESANQYFISKMFCFSASYCRKCLVNIPSFFFFFLHTVNPFQGSRTLSYTQASLTTAWLHIAEITAVLPTFDVTELKSCINCHLKFK